VSAIEADGARSQRARLAAATDEPEMSHTLVVLVTGAGRGMGVDLARAALDVTDPTSVQAGADAVAGVEQKATDLFAQVDARRDLSSCLAHADA
jgi:hypothetical protein